MRVLLYHKQDQTFNFDNFPISNSPNSYLQFTDTAGGEFAAAGGGFDFLKVLNHILGYDLKLVEGESQVIRNTSERGILLAAVYDPILDQNLGRTGDGPGVALTNLIQHLIELHR